MMGDGVWAGGEGAEDDDEGFAVFVFFLGTVCEDQCCFTFDCLELSCDGDIPDAACDPRLF